MKRLLFSTLIILLTLNSYSQTGTKNFIDVNYIEVTGKAEMEISPDLIYIKVLISEKDTKNKISLSELEHKMATKLEDIGIDIQKELLIKDMASNFKYYLLNKDDILLSKEYQILVHDGQTAGKVFIELEKLGISNINIDKLDHSHMLEYKKQIKIDAIKAAQEKAQYLSEAIDQGIGGAMYIQEINNYQARITSANAIRLRSNMKAESALDIDFEKIHLEYAILCRFKIKTKQ